MIKKKIVLIETDEILKKYLMEKLAAFNIQIIACKDGFEGIIKIKNENPDLIISASNLERMDIFQILKEKQEHKATLNIPVIVLLPSYDEELSKKFAAFQVSKILSKPLKVDLLCQYVGDILKIRIDFDRTPSVIEAHINGDVLFIEVANGINKEKIEVLRYKIIHLVKAYERNLTKVLVIFSSIEKRIDLSWKLELLFDIILDETSAVNSTIKILTAPHSIIVSAMEMTKYKDVKICEDFTSAIDSLGKVDLFAYGDEIDQIKSEILTSSELIQGEIPIDLTFSTERMMPVKDHYSIAIIDDDLPILEYMSTVLEGEGWTTHPYENPIVFLKDFNNNPPDLIFLDLMMPEMNGFQLVKYFRDKNIFIPIVIITALSQKELVVKAGEYGISNFLTKPVRADVLVNKAKELLSISF